MKCIMMENGIHVALTLFNNVTWKLSPLWVATTSVAAVAGAAFWYTHQRAIKRLRDLLTEQELKALRVQLNPHLLQNTFEILAARLVQQDINAAIAYIRQVADYLRLVLSVSDKSTTSLEEEIELAEKYLALQKSTWQGAPDYRITVDDTTDTFGTIVPGMLLQPILENSIRHGFGNKPFAGAVITVSIEQREPFIVCSVADNGTGLQAKPVNAQHHSRGHQLTLQRMQLLYRNSRHKPSMELTSNDRGGATTILRIPIE